MGCAAELCSEKSKISRQEQDKFAIMSYERAQAAQRRGDFKKEIVPVPSPLPSPGGRGREGEGVVEEDEEVKKFDAEKMRRLKPAFREGGTVTAGNASSVSDGAAAVVVMERERALALGIKPLVRVVGYGSSAREPEWFTIAPVEAIAKLLKNCGCSVADVDLFEINEAFAASSIAVNRELGLDSEKVNVRGGAIALGHPIGASGARIFTTLVHALVDMDKRRGVAALCIGGGEAVAMLVERYEG
jgi:acetyl-CoA C-acetyltransferase